MPGEYRCMPGVHLNTEFPEKDCRGSHYSRFGGVCSPLAPNIAQCSQMLCPFEGSSLCHPLFSRLQHIALLQLPQEASSTSW